MPSHCARDSVAAGGRLSPRCLLIVPGTRWRQGVDCLRDAFSLCQGLGGGRGWTVSEMPSHCAGDSVAAGGGLSPRCLLIVPGTPWRQGVDCLRDAFPLCQGLGGGRGWTVSEMPSHCARDSVAAGGGLSPRCLPIVPGTRWRQGVDCLRDAFSLCQGLGGGRGWTVSEMPSHCARDSVAAGGGLSPRCLLIVPGTRWRQGVDCLRDAFSLCQGLGGGRGWTVSEMPSHCARDSVAAGGGLSPRCLLIVPGTRWRQGVDCLRDAFSLCRGLGGGRGWTVSEMPSHCARDSVAAGGGLSPRCLLIVPGTRWRQGVDCLRDAFSLCQGLGGGRGWTVSEMPSHCARDSVAAGGGLSPRCLLIVPGTRWRQGVDCLRDAFPLCRGLGGGRGWTVSEMPSLAKGCLMYLRVSAQYSQTVPLAIRVLSERL